MFINKLRLKQSLGLRVLVTNILFVILGLLIALFGFAKSHYAENYDEEIKPRENTSQPDSLSGTL